jgi:putative transposase
MRKSFNYCLYPTSSQETALKATLEECRWLYNHLLEERKRAYEETGHSPGLYAQQAALPALKWDRPTLATAHSQVLQNVAVRVNLAFQAFFRRVRAGEEPGYPRFRGKGRYDSFCYPQFGFKIVGGRVRLSGIGDVKAILHRPVEAPRFLRRDEQRLKRAQRRREKAPKGSALRRRRRKIEARVHERITDRRAAFAHKQARDIVTAYGTICVEDLAITRLVRNHCLAKSIHDAAWRQFLAFLVYKARRSPQPSDVGTYTYHFCCAGRHEYC